MIEYHPLFVLSIVLTTGLIGGEIVSRLRMPRVTGWILTGIALRSLDLDVLSLKNISEFSPLTDFILGYIAFTVGAHLNFRSLRNTGKRLVFLMLAEATITPMLVAGAMYWLGGFPLSVSFVFAAIAVAGAPGTTMLVIREARAKGVFAKTLIAAVALIDMVAVCLFVLIDTQLSQGAVVNDLSFIIAGLPTALKTLALSGGLAIATALGVILMTRAIVGAKLLGASLVAAILLAWGAAGLFGVSSILTCTFVGVALGNFMGEKEHAGEAYLNSFGDILFTAFYTLAGLRLNFSDLPAVAGLVALFFGFRAIGKCLSTFISMSLAGAVKSVRHYLGIALLPHGGVAVGLIFYSQDSVALAEYANTILIVGLSALAINQLIGPSATKFALMKSGEVGLDRPRLLDFIREQDIITNFQAKDRRHAIKQLVDRLFQTHSVSINKDIFLKRVLDRDQNENTCLGEGLMIPHGVLDDDDASIVGVMAISKEGLDFDTPDGKPVHTIVLLATPANRSRHLEVLGALARALGQDRNIRDQIFKTRSAAHAYHILHADETDEFNYFLEDAFQENES